MCVRVVQLSARKAFSLWSCSALDCPRGLQNLHSCRLLTKSRQMSLQTQAGTADPASRWQMDPSGLRGAAAPGQPVQASGLSGKWEDTCSGGAICTEHPWLFYPCSFSSCILRFCSLPLVPGAAGVCRLLCWGLHARLTWGLQSGKSSQEDWLGCSRLQSAESWTR